MINLLDFFNDRTESLVAHVENLVQFESPTADKALVDALGRYLHDELVSLGAAVEVLPRDSVGDIRLAKWNAESDGPPILLLGHMDTVWPAGTLNDSVPLKRDEYKLYGPGALDMKAGIVIALEAIRGLQALNAMPQRPIWMLLNTDEEVGSMHSREVIVETAQQCGLCLVLEPAAENEGLKTSRKGIAQYTVQARGVSSHAGNAPEEGINAVVELAHQAVAIHKLNNLRQGTSVSVTTFEGGTAGNVIPRSAECYVDVRFFHKGEAERVDTAMGGLQPALLGSEIMIDGGINRYPLVRDEQMQQNFRQAKQIAESIGLPLREAAVGGVSDANLTAAAGVPTLDGLGGHGEGMHALHEHVLIRSLPRRAALLAALLRDWTFAGD